MMTNIKTYDKYSIPLEKQMKKIGSLGKGLAREIEGEGRRVGETQFIYQSAMLLRKLSEGEGALEVYQYLDRDLANTKNFLDSWEPSNLMSGSSQIYADYQNVYKEMLYFKQLVDQTPPEVLDQIKANVEKVRELKKKCFIATAVYGDENCHEVQVLRDFRDNVLQESGLGRKVIDFYYGGAGMKAARFIENHVPFAIPPIRKGLDLIVEKYERK
jgi:hypothetical protein